MSDKIKKDLKKSNINATSDFDFYQIERKSKYLLDCKVKRTLDEVSFEFTYHQEQPFEKIRELSIVFKYQALINIQNLINDVKRIKISLNPGNLTYDTNMMPKAIMRDIYKDTSFNENDFISQYKALIGYVLQNKYSFEDYYQGGNQLLNKNKITTPFLEAKTLNELVDILNKEYNNVQNKLKNNYIEVDKRKFKRLKIINRVGIGLLIISIFVGGYFGGYRLYEETLFNQANEAYIKQDYISVRDILENIGVSRMNINTKYILAFSNVKVESLTDEQQNNILSSVSLNSDERILEFWIYLGKSDMEEAIDIAKQLGNEEYIAYGYMKEKAIIENDTSLSGSEREEKLKEIENNLEELNLGNEDSTNQ